VTDPSTLQVFAGLDKDGTVRTTETPGFNFAVFSYRPSPTLSLRPIMEQGQAIADSLPALSGTLTISQESLRRFLWAPWTQPQYTLRLKKSYGILQKTFLGLPSTPSSVHLGEPATAGHRAGRKLIPGPS
jgi:hypothetical protein